MASTFRLLMTSDLDGSGWEYTYNLCKSMQQKSNIEICILGFGNDVSANTHNLENIQIIPTNLLSEKEITTLNDKHYLDEIKKQLEQVLKDFRPHIVHLNHILCSSVIQNYPALLYTQGNIFSLFKNQKSSSQNFFETIDIMKDALNNSQAIVMPSMHSAYNLVKSFDIKNKIRVIYNGLSILPKEEIHLNSDIIVDAYMLKKHQDISLLNKIASKLPDNINIKVLDNDKIFSQNRKIKSITYKNNEDIETAYNDSSIYLSLTGSESFNMIKAAYLNCALIVNNTPVMKEMWGDCACLFQKSNPNSLLRSINNLIENKEKLKQSIQNCHVKALSVYNSQRMAQEYLNLYKNILKKNIEFMKKMSGK